MVPGYRRARAGRGHNKSSRTYQVCVRVLEFRASGAGQPGFKRKRSCTNTRASPVSELAFGPPVRSKFQASTKGSLHGFAFVGPCAFMAGQSRFVSGSRSDGEFEPTPGSSCSEASPEVTPEMITPNPIPSLFSSSPGDRSGRQSETDHSLRKEYRKQCFGYIWARLRFDQNAYSRQLLPACTSSPA